MPARAQPFGQRVAGAGRPALDVGQLHQPVVHQFRRQLHLALTHRVVGDDDLVHALEIVDTDQIEFAGVEIGFFLDLAAHAILRRFGGLHEAGDQRKHLARPGGVLCQQHFALVFNYRRQHGRRVVPMRVVAGAAAQALFVTAVLGQRDQTQRLSALRAETKRGLHGVSFCARIRPGRRRSRGNGRHGRRPRTRSSPCFRAWQFPAPPSKHLRQRCRQRCPPRAPDADTCLRLFPG